jgi:fatty acid amide hydrolase
VELFEASTLELLRLLEGKEASSVEIVSALLERSDAIDGDVRALAHRFPEHALEAARSADDARARGEPLGPLHGIPVTIKESIATRGTAVTLGVRTRADRIAADDAVVVRLLREAGAVVFAKGNVSQTLLFNESENPIWGRTRNPWNLDRVPGGSSGGEAAALAAGLTPLGIGTDIGGSIRVPAAYCGVAGFKPTVDRWSMIGCVGALAGQELIRAQCGPMARTATDVAFAFRAIDTVLHSALDPQVPPIRTPDPATVRIDRLRVGVYEDDGFFPASASVRRAVLEAAEALRLTGVEVVPFAPPKVPELTYLYFAALSSDGGRRLEQFLEGDDTVPQLSSLRLLARLPKPLRLLAASYLESVGEARLERLLRAVHEKPVVDYWALAAERTALRLEVLSAWDQAGLDAVLCPPHATPPLRHGQSRDFSLGGASAMLYNTLNFPAGVVPVSIVRPEESIGREPRDRLEKVAREVERGSTGLPLGVQVVARPHRDEVCLAVMIAVEAALPRDAARPRTPISPRGGAVDEHRIG